MKIDFAGCRDLPLSAMSKTLRSLTGLKTIHIHLGYQRLSLRHARLDQEIKDPESALSHFYDSSCAVGSALRPQCTWLPDLLDNKSFRYWAWVPTVAVHMRLESKRCRYAGQAPLEEFDIAVVLDCKCLTLSGALQGQEFTVPQKPRSTIRKSQGQFNIILDEAPSEESLHNLVSKCFPDLQHNPESMLMMLRFMDSRHNISIQGPPSDKWVHKARAIGERLLRPHDHYPWYLGPDVLCDLWRRILQVTDEKLLARKWKDKWDLVKDIEALAEQPSYMEFHEQRFFFQRLGGFPSPSRNGGR